MAADKLGCGMNHHVCPVLDGTDEIGGAEGVVNDQRQAVLMGDGCNGVDIGNIGVGVAQGLDVDCLGVVLNGALDLAQVMGIHKGCLNAIQGQGMGQQVGGAAVNGLLGYNVLALLCQRLKGVGDGCCTGSHCQTCNAALQRCDTLFKYVLGRVGQTAIDIARISQAKTVGSVLGVVEHIRSGGIDGNGTCVGYGIGLLLANVKLQGFKFIFRHNNNLFL